VDGSAGKLSIVIDDFGYRPQTENQVLALPSTISVAVLPRQSQRTGYGKSNCAKLKQNLSSQPRLWIDRLTLAPVWL
jgi:polysaccharide deacetylase 2 family uncharacterized protein YibQ